MATHGKGTGVLIGPYNPTTYLRDISYSGAVDTAETTGFMTQDKTYVVGMSDATVSCSGLHQRTEDVQARADEEAIFEGVNTLEASTPVLIALEGWKVGGRVRMGKTKRVGFDIQAPISDVVSISGNLQADGGMRGGHLLKDPTAATAATGSTAALVAPASPSGTIRVQLHVLANTRTAATTFTVQTSNDGATWVDAGTFDSLAAATLYSGVLIVPLARPQVRVLATLAGGSGTLNYTAAVAPN